MNNVQIDIMNNRLSYPNGKAYICGGLDTFTEECLYILCSGSGEKMEIFYAWQANKTKFVSILSTIEFEFQHYSRHDQSHARAIVESIEMFLGRERIQKLGIGDLWLLLNCAYSHDIGMAIKNEELLKIWCSDKFKEYVQKEVNNSEFTLKRELHYLYQLDNIIRNKDQMDGLDKEIADKQEYTDDWPVHARKYVASISAEYIRSKHAERSKEYLDDFMNKYRESLGAQVTEKRLYNVMGEIAYSHSTDGQYILDHLKYETNGFGNEKIHPQFIAALLGLGDLLDMDNNRFDRANIEHFGELPTLSETHMKKHLAISHMRITEYEIEAVAESKEYDVCVEAQKWFDWLENSVKFITSNWNKLAPKELDGCIFKECTLKILFNGENFQNDVSKRFSIDQKKAFKLFIGDPLYGSKQAWIREYIQNALDATKMLLWIRGKEGMGVFKDGGKNQKYVSPLDLNQNILNDYGITIKLELLGAHSEQKKEDFFRISIIDKGIGIEKECIQAISEVGAGWRKRTSYQKEIAEMPEWLKPTGGFGIGIQAGFMITDKIYIETSGLRDNKGYHIELHSPKTGGNISIIEKSSQPVSGTTISLEMTIEQASEYYGNNCPKELPGGGAAGFDYFDYSELLHRMYYGIWDEVKEKVSNSLIPIKIEAYEEDGNIFDPEKGKPNAEYIKAYPNIIQSDLLKRDLALMEPVLESSCEIIYDKKEAWMWDGNKEILFRLAYTADNIPDSSCRIEEKETDEKLYKCTYYFKGIHTYFHESPKVARVPKLDVKIDFLGYRAGDCLLASRDAFSGDFKGWESIREYLHLFCEFLADKCEKQDKYAIEIVKYDEIQYLFVWDALFYDGNEFIKELIRKDIAVKAQKLLFSEEYALADSREITLDTVYETLRKKEELIIFGLEKDNKARDESISVENRKEQLKLSEGQTEQKQQGFWEDVDVEDTLLEGKVYYTSRLIFEMLSEYKQFQAKTVYLIEQPVRYWYIKEWACKKKDIGISLPAALAKAYNEMETYIVVDREKNKFLDLVVEKPPLCQEQVDLKLYKESEVILLPFINSAYLMLGSRSDAKLVNKEEFIRRIQEGKQWAKAVNWTVNKHKGKAYVTRTQIEKEYTELCEMLYDIAEFEYRKKMKNVNSV